jgi:tetratricopeptide (TPR) repeat protein
VGDSVTFGLGAPRTQSYPAQLERLLNTKESKRTYTVINRGRPGQNTAQLLETLEGDIREVEPDIVTVLTGGANLWNYWGYQAYRHRSRFPSRIYDQLYRIRLYKLVKLLCLNIPSKTQRKEPNKYPPLQALIPDEETIDLSDESIATAHKTRNSETYWKIGRAYMEKGDYDQALNWFQEGISMDPTFSRNYEAIGWLYYQQKLYDKALPWFMKALDRSPSGLHCYDGIAQVFSGLHLYSEAVDFFSKEKARNPAANDFMLMFKLKKKMLIEREVKQWVQVDIGKMISICAKRNIKIILQNYPDEYLIDGIFWKVGNKYGIPFVNHSQVFTQILEKRASRGQYFFPDGHPNARGYGVMASNIWKTLKETFPNEG